ncbi:DUF6273 domain-containing protein [Flavonifractor sp.]|uniref:DUF6273 domain-containing protein n=1 Tax=Flavonifractor sp. TaxID=2049025 RepID=UPI00307C1DF8
MAEEFYQLPESPEYNAEAIRKIQDTDPVRASTIINPVVLQMIVNTHVVKKQADQNTLAVAAAAEAAEDADKKAAEALAAAQSAAKIAAQAGTDASNALTAADAALEAITKLAHTIDAVPTQNGSLTYTGSEQSPTWNSYNPETLIIGGVTRATNAGSYIATFTPAEGYTWGDDTNTTKEVTWTISRATIAKAPSQSGSLTYTGSAQSPTWNDYSSTQLTIGGTTSATNAGSHTATFTPTSNYQWSDGTITARSVAWQIQRAAISTTPTQSGSLTYTGSAQSPSWSNYDSSKLTIGGTTSGTNAGSYNATFTPTSNYQWSDGGTGAKTVAWKIGKAAGSLSLNKTSITLNKSTSATTITVTRAGDGAITATSSSTSIATVSVSGNTVTVTGKAYGSATITVKVAEGTNHTAPANKTCAVQVNLFNATLNSNTWAAIKAASDIDEGANYWSAGDTKTIKINGKVGNFTFSNLSINAFILGFNHNSAKEGTHRIHWQLGKIGGTMVGLCDNQYNSSVSGAGYFHMNDSNTNVGGWKDSSMRKTLLGNSKTPSSPLANSLMAALPSDLRAVMKSVTKYTDNTGNGSNSSGNVTATTDYLWLLAEFEVHGSRNYANQYEQNSQAQYAYYKAGNSKIAYNHTAVSTAVWWWLRSPTCNSSPSFCNVSAGGGNGGNYAYYSAALLPGFAT